MKKSLTRAGIALAGATLAVTGVLAGAGTASAGWSDCPAGALCAYLDINGGGTPGKVYDDNANLLQYTKFDNALSAYNHGNNCNVKLYNGLNWSGSSQVLNRGAAFYDLRGSIFERNIASNDWCV
ncbi:peptidase inhibitor family I36 protein [Streptomyces sp. NPDC101118]|uniref:peptidase inhibitor family I36 protein n=1 Tax=Streptomyces sp. NPDC101118 TaxID=3366109 RepID=UPI0037FD03FF